MSRSIPKKRGIVKPVKGKKPARYTQKLDALGRRYTLDSKSGKRVSNELWEREQAKLRPKPKSKSKAKPKVKAKAPKAPKARRQSTHPAEQSVSIPRNIFDVWDIPNAEWKRELAAKHLSNVERWEPEEYVDEDEKLIFAHENAEVEAELAFRAAKAERDREILSNAEEFIPTTRIKGFAEGLLERAERYPRVKRALTLATGYANQERSEVVSAQVTGYPPTKDEFIRGRFLHAIEQDEDIEAVVGDLADMFEEDVHDIYEIYFSPEVA